MLKALNRVELEKMRNAGRLAAEVLDMITDHVKEGVTTLELNDICHEFIVKNNAVPAPLNYRGFPKSICTSINEVVCHGIPSTEDVLKDGDIMNIDVTVIVDGYHGDTSRMYYIGNVSDDAKHLVNTTYDAMMAGIATVKSGSFVSDIGKAIQPLAESNGFSVVREYCGHGIHKVFHDDPQILHYEFNDPRFDKRFKKGVTFTIEPMINVGGWETELLSDDWTVKTRDRKLSAQFEHTMAVTADGVEIFTKSPNGQDKPPY